MNDNGSLSNRVSVSEGWDFKVVESNHFTYQHQK